MARKNPIVEELKEKLRRAELRAENELELKHRVQGKLEKYEEEEERRKEERHMMVREREDYTRRLESDVAWMRRLVEFLTIPKEKLKDIQEFNNKIEITGSDRGFPPRY